MGMSYLTPSIQLLKNIAYVGSLKYFSVEIHFTMYFLISLIIHRSTFSVNKTEPRKDDKNDTYACTWLVLRLGLGSVEPWLNPRAGDVWPGSKNPFR